MPVTITVLVALLVCLIPTTIGGLLSAIGLAGIGRTLRANVIAMSGRAVEAAGDVDVLLLDKTGTITLGNRQASDFLPAGGVNRSWPMRRSSPRSPTRRRKAAASSCSPSRKYNLRERDMAALGATFVPFTAQTRMSGVDIGERRIRKGAADAIKAPSSNRTADAFPPEMQLIVDTVARRGSTPLVVADGGRVLGVIELKDIVKGGIKERFAELRRMGIKTVMITGDNRLTAAAIAAEAGVDDFLAEATPEAKLKLIREHQAGGASSR